MTIRLLPGSHTVPAGGLILSGEHTPAVGRRVRWVGGGAASLNGAIPVTGWTPSTEKGMPSGAYVASAPATALRGTTARHMWVDGVRAQRTRTRLENALPANAHLKLVADTVGYSVQAGGGGGGGGGGTECSADYGKDTPCCGQPHDPGTKVPKQNQCPSNLPVCVGYVYDQHYGHCIAAAPPGPVPPPPPTPAPAWENADDVEFVYSGVAQGWSEARCAVQNVSGTTITMKQPCFYNLVNRKWQPVNGEPPVYVDNVKAHFGENPGEFYHDKAAGLIYYLPLPGQSMGSASAVVAVEETLVAHNASSRHQWDGVTFEYATWLRPGQGAGFVEQQSAACDDCPIGGKGEVGCGSNDTFAITPGNVVVSAATNISFDNCTFQHLGAYAAAAAGGSQGIAWRGCNFTDVSAGSHMLGGISNEVLNETDPTKWDRDMLVEDCRIIDIPVEYTGATGLFAGYVAHLTVQHNHFANQSYSGMTIGWGWGRTGSGRGNNHILANIVERPTTVRCCDGGAIYTLGPQPGSTLTGNYIVDHSPPLGTSNCIYHDNGSGGFNDTANICEGHWHDVAVNGKLGPYGPCGECPSFESGTPSDCHLYVVGNYFQTSGAERESAATTSSGCDQVHTGPNTIIGPSDPLPPAAIAVKAAAGPRY